MREVVIAPLRSPADLDDVLAIEAESFTNPWTREMYESELTSAGVSHVLLARDGGGQVVGFCSFWRVVDEVHVNNLAVRPSHRRRGIGRALLVHMLRDASAQGATRALLEVRRSNEEARRLYESLGFAVAGVRKQYYSRPIEDAIVLWREHLDQLAPDVRGHA